MVGRRRMPLDRFVRVQLKRKHQRGGYVLGFFTGWTLAAMKQLVPSVANEEISISP